MTDEERELEGWRSDWQTLGGEATFTADLAARVVRDGKRIRRSTIREILMVSSSSAIALWLVVREHGKLEVALICGVLFVFNGVWITRLLSVREGMFRAESEGLDAFVDLTRRRMVAELRWSAFGLAASAVISLIVVAWDVWAFVNYLDRFRAEPWRAVVSFGFTAVVLVGLRVWMKMRKRKVEAERDRFEVLVAERTMP